MPDLRINIHNTNNRNTIVEKEYPKFDDSAICLKSEGGSLAAKNVRILFEPSAVRPLFESIDWGGRYRYGDVEQAGMLIGNYYRDCTSMEEVIWADVVMVVPADPSLVNASFEAIDITAAAWSKMYEDAAEFHTENLQIVGWYHTHLDNISTRFSSVDRDTQSRAFTYEYSFGVVFNPNRGKWSAFYGPDSQECIGELLLNEELAGRCWKPQITISQVNGDSFLQEDGSIVHVEEPGRQGEGCPSNGFASNIAEANTLSFFQWLRQRLPGLNRREIDSGGSYADWIAQPFPEWGSGEQCRQERWRGEKPKIEFKNNDRAEMPKIECAFYLCGAASDVFHQCQNVRCIVRRGAIEEIMKCRQYNLKYFKKDAPILGCVVRDRYSIEFSHVTTKDKANAKVIFINQSLGDETSRYVMKEFQRCRKANIKFAVLVGSDDLRCVLVSIVQL